LNKISPIRKKGGKVARVDKLFSDYQIALPKQLRENKDGSSDFEEVVRRFKKESMKKLALQLNEVS
jgi:hypothetical protein